MARKKSTEERPIIIQTAEDMQAAIAHAFGYKIDLEACRATLEKYEAEAREEEEAKRRQEFMKNLEEENVRLTNEKAELTKRIKVMAMNNAALHEANASMISALKVTKDEVEKLIKIWEDRE